MRLKALEAIGFKSFAKKTPFIFEAPITAIVGPNGSGKSNAADACRFVLGEKSMKSLRSRRGEDLIFGGSRTLPRMSRARVTLIFDNKGRQFPLDYNEVTIAREVYRDGVNTYLINDSPVRLRDIYELLNSVSLGAPDRYIINQGESDRVLSVGEEERRFMVEDALGLRIYQYRIEESGKKFKKTEENIEQAEALRREILPHLKFLAKQVKKIEQAESLRRDLRALLEVYLPTEQSYLVAEEKLIEETKHKLGKGLGSNEKELTRVERETESREKESDPTRRLAQINASLLAVRGQKDKENRELGRLEGIIELERERGKLTERPAVFNEERVFLFVEFIKKGLGDLEELADLTQIKKVINQLKNRVESFWRGGDGEKKADVTNKQLQTLLQKQKAIVAKLGELEKEEKQLVGEKMSLEQSISERMNTLREADRVVYTLRARCQELRLELGTLLAKEEKLKLEKTDFSRELKEAEVLLGGEVVTLAARTSGTEETRQAQAERRRQIERHKIRLEDMGAGNDETLKEYQEVSERDAYLSREINDLKQSAVSLKKIIADLRQKIDEEFQTGLQKINGQFQEFFALMFDGGKASLEIARRKKTELVEDEEGEEEACGLEQEGPSIDRPGLSVKVNLPRKKIKGLAMLSGGERALVSIALLFAMSQVNPPPFLILDETDATLDEVNSRKYGDMLESLAKHSQLIVITHNRETMSRAGVIYGVTMARDGISQLLSIKFDRAVSYAK